MATAEPNLRAPSAQDPGAAFQAGRPKAWPVRFFQSLAGRLLGLVIAFIFIAEVLIFLPSLAGYYQQWLRERVDAAQIAALALEGAPAEGVTEALEQELLANAEVELVALQRQGERVLRLSGATPPESSDIRLIDLRAIAPIEAAAGGLQALLPGEARWLRVIAKPRLESGDYIEILLRDGALRRDIRAFAKEVVLVSLLVSLITAGLVYLALLLMFVGPMRRLTRQIERFRERPEDVSRAIRPSGRSDEIGRAEVALADMENQVRHSLRQSERLANLGRAVAKIAHDLRSGLATAQLLTERLAGSADPSVRQIAPRLERAIERAGGLAQAALKYGKAEEPAPVLAPQPARALLDEAAAEALAAYPQIGWTNAAPEGLNVVADADGAHRIFANLMRNAARAIAEQPGRAAPGAIAATATLAAGRVLIRIVDDGPGLPARAKERLFEAFAGSADSEGAGLGLNIARELAKAQGGELKLVQTGPQGTAFEVSLPAAEAR